MGTRADFYVAEEDGIAWRGSIAWDGYPEGIDDPVLAARDVEAFDAALAEFFSSRDDVTLPEQGWPWPWDDSRTSDFAYVLIRGEGVVFSSFGKQPYWANRRNEEDDYEPARLTLAFPSMSARKQVATGTRSGTIMVGF